MDDTYSDTHLKPFTYAPCLYVVRAFRNNLRLEHVSLWQWKPKYLISSDSCEIGDLGNLAVLHLRLSKCVAVETFVEIQQIQDYLLK